MALRNEVLNRLQLAYIDFEVNQLHQQQAMKQVSLAPAATVLGAVALALALNCGAPVTASAASSSAHLHHGVMTCAQTHTLTLSGGATEGSDPLAMPPTSESGGVQPLRR